MPSRLVLAVRILCLACLMVGAPMLSAHADGPPRLPITIPFDSTAGHANILVRIRINDNLTGNFILDTGAFASIIGGDFVKKLGSHVKPTIRPIPIYLSGREIDDVILSKLVLGNLALDDVHMFVEPNMGALRSGSESVCAKERARERKEHPERFAHAEPLDQTVDGIIGMDVLSHFALCFDFVDGEITAWYGGKLTADEIDSVDMTHATIVPIDSEDSGGGHYVVKANFTNGSLHGTEKMTLDTGAEDTLVAPHLADIIKIPVKHEGYSQTFYGCLPFSEGIVDSIGLNGLTLPKIGVSFTRKAPSDFPLLLGYNVYSQCRVIFDFPASKLYLQPISDIEKYDKPAAQFTDAISYQPGPNGEIFLPVQFAAGTAGTAVINTGSIHSVLSPDVAARMSMALTPLLDENGVPVMMNGKAMQTGTVPLLRFGGKSVSGFSSVVSPTSLTVAGKPVDMILGTDFLALFLPYLDFQKHQVTFLECLSLVPGDFAKLGMENAATIPIIKPTSALCCARALVTNKTTMEEAFLVSTTDPSTLLSSRVGQTLKLKAGTPAPLSTAFGTVPACPIMLDSFTLGGLDAPDGMRYQMQTDTDALPLSILGLDLLSHYRVLLDYPHGRLYLDRPAPTVLAPMSPATPAPVPDKKPL